MQYVGKGGPGLPRAASLAGQRFGSLVVESRAGLVGDKRGVMWLCRCDCGAAHVTLGYRLRGGRVRSCGAGCEARRAS